MAHGEGEVPPHALDAADLKRVRDEFVATAKRAVRLGIEAVELHGAHGYLLHQFLSPIANKRTDEYGGSLANRMRYPLEIYDAVRQVVPAGSPVWFRVSATDWVEDGWDLDETVELAQALKKAAPPRSTSRPGASRPSRRSRSGRAIRCPMPSGSRPRPASPPSRWGSSPSRSRPRTSSEGKADAISLARAMLYNPRWPWHAAAELGARVHAPKQYWRSQPHHLKDLFKDTSFGQR